MELIKVSMNCYYSTPDDATDRPCLGIIKTSEKTSIMIDAGASEAHAKEFLKLIEDFKLPYPSLCILTHSHWDHTFGLNALGIPCYATSETYFKMKYENDDLLAKARILASCENYKDSPVYAALSEESKFCIDHMMVEYDSNFSNVKLALPSNRIPLYTSIPSCTGQIYAYPNPIAPHCSDSTFVYAAEDKVLFVGDALYRHFDLDIDHDTKWIKERLPIYQKLISELEELDFEFCIKGHEDVITKDELLEDLFSQFYIGKKEE